MRISDWSSDVCSSDLPGVVQFAHHAHHAAVIERAIGAQEDLWRLIAGHAGRALLEPRGQPLGPDLVIVDDDAPALVERDLARLMLLIQRVGAAVGQVHGPARAEQPRRAPGETGRAPR